MSTKIYNGIKLTGDLSFADLRKNLIQLSKEFVIPESLKKLDKIVVNLMAKGLMQEVYNVRYRANNPEFLLHVKEAFRMAVDEVRDRRKEVQKTGSRDPAVDTDASIVIIPLSSGKILAMPYIQMNDIYKAFLTKLPHEYYGYWDNADQEEGVSDADWKVRGKEWEEALPSGIPAMDGYTIVLMPEDYPYYPDRSEILKKLLVELDSPLLHQNVAKDMFIECVAPSDEFANVEGMPKMDESNQSASAFMKHHRELNNWAFNTDSGKQFYQDVCVKRTQVILEEIRKNVEAALNPAETPKAAI